MSDRGNILVVDDTPAAAKLLADVLGAQGYSVRTASHALAALEAVEQQPPDLLLTDLLMPGMDGVELTARLRAEPRWAKLAIVVVTAMDERCHRLRALEAGADEFISKPVDQQELKARVCSLMRIRRLLDTVERQAGELSRWALELEQRVASEVARNQRLSRLQRFFSPRLAERLLADDGEALLDSHRREIVVVFLDLRGYTAFSETAAPEEVMQALGEFHAAMGQEVMRFEGTLERFTGDGMMVFFNDPEPVPDAPRRAVEMALAMQRAAAELHRRWRSRGFELTLAIGIAQGFATLGRIGYEGRIDYGAIGAVTNLAQRLCALAAGGQIFSASRVVSALGGDVCSVEPCGVVTPAGFSRPVEIVLLRDGRPNGHEAQ